jgi:recombination protein U
LNAGKQFEKDFKDSIPNDVFFYRFRDGTSSWDKGEMTRFQQSNMCDCMMMYNGTLYLLELKSDKGKSIPLSCFRDNQIKELSNANNYNHIKSGFIINMRDIEKTYYIGVQSFIAFTETYLDKKSIPVSWLQENGLKIGQVKLKVHYRYNLNELLSR